MRINPLFKISIASVLWGAGGVMVKLLDLPSPILTFYRLFVPTFFLFIYLLYKKENIKRLFTPLLLGASFLNCIRMFLFFVAMNLTSVGNSVVMLYTWPIFIALFSFLFLKEKVSILEVILLAAAFAGIVIIYLDKKFSFSDKDFLGMSVMLVSAIIYAVSVIIFKKQSKGVTSFETTFLQNFLGGFIFMPFLFINYQPISMNKFLGVIGYAFLIGVVGYVLFFSALKQTDATVASYFSFLEVPSGIIFGIIILKEKLVWNLILGASIIIISVLIMQIQEHRKSLNRQK